MPDTFRGVRRFSLVNNSAVVIKKLSPEQCLRNGSIRQNSCDPIGPRRPVPQIYRDDYRRGRAGNFLARRIKRGIARPPTIRPLFYNLKLREAGIELGFRCAYRYDPNLQFIWPMIRHHFRIKAEPRVPVLACRPEKLLAASFQSKIRWPILGKRVIAC